MALFANVDNLIDEAKNFGKQFADSGLKAHQLRRIYDRVQNIKEKAESKGIAAEIIGELKLLKPQLAYAASRKENLKPLQEKLSELIDKIKSPKDVREFFDFLQSILAYHKYFAE